MSRNIVVLLAALLVVTAFAQDKLPPDAQAAKKKLLEALPNFDKNIAECRICNGNGTVYVTVPVTVRTSNGRVGQMFTRQKTRCTECQGSKVAVKPPYGDRSRMNDADRRRYDAELEDRRKDVEAQFAILLKICADTPSVLADAEVARKLGTAAEAANALTRCIKLDQKREYAVGDLIIIPRATHIYTSGDCSYAYQSTERRAFLAQEMPSAKWVPKHQDDTANPKLFAETLLIIGRVVEPCDGFTRCKDMAKPVFLEPVYRTPD